jgi:hypothetical protein
MAVLGCEEAGAWQNGLVLGDMGLDHIADTADILLDIRYPQEPPQALSSLYRKEEEHYGD